MSMKKSQNTVDSDAIELYLTITGSYMKFAAVTILSVLENASRHINVSILCSEVSDEDRDRISFMVRKFDANVAFIIISDEQWNLLRGVKVCQFSYSSRPMIGYIRFLIPHICSAKKALYMDSDMIAVGDISPLWDTDFTRDGKEYAFAAAKGGPWKEWNLLHGLSEDFPQINTGILLFNCAKWRKDKMFDQLMDITKRTHYDVILHDDQCTLNIWASQNEGYAKFGYEYNIMANENAPDNLKILHYIVAKPWIDSFCKHADKWWNVAGRTPYHGVFMEMLRNQETNNVKNYSVFTSCLEILKVKHTTGFSNQYFNRHLYKHSLFGISQMLSDYEVKNAGIKVENKEQDIFNIECPFITQVNGIFVVVYKVKADKVYYIQDGKKISAPVPVFIRAWPGVVLLVEATPDSMEPDFEEHRKKEELECSAEFELASPSLRAERSNPEAGTVIARSGATKQSINE